MGKRKKARKKGRGREIKKKGEKKKPVYMIDEILDILHEVTGHIEDLETILVFQEVIIPGEHINQTVVEPSKENC